MTDLERAKELLKTNPRFTCVLAREEQVLTSEKTGISPVMDFIRDRQDLKGFAVADRIVGKAAAMLFNLAGISSAFAEVASQAALDFCRKNGPCLAYGTLVSHIINRQHNGPCPMEQTVLDIEDPQEAFRLLLSKRQQLAQGKQA